MELLVVIFAVIAIIAVMWAIKANSDGERTPDEPVVPPAWPKPEVKIDYRDRPVEKIVEVERIVHVEAPTERYDGPPQWQFNEEFTAFVEALGEVIVQKLPESQHDRRKLAERAGLSVSTIDNLASGSNPQLQTLWKVCQARRLRLSSLLEEVEQAMAARREQPAQRSERWPSVQ